MKTALFAAILTASVVSGAVAQGTATITANPNTFSLAPGDTFNVTFTLQSGPAVVSGFDLFLESNSANVDNNFSITVRTLAHSGTDADLPSYPDAISTSTSDHSGFAQNQHDQGAFFDSDQNVPTDLVTLTLQVGANTPSGSYTFSTTSSNTGVENKATLVFGGPSTSDDLNQFSVTPTSFTVTVVPEPSVWLLISVGAAASFAAMRRHRRQS
jgi:PEP-CTERM motif